jgi:hypothetical protein
MMVMLGQHNDTAISSIQSIMFYKLKGNIAIMIINADSNYTFVIKILKFFFLQVNSEMIPALSYNCCLFLHFFAFLYTQMNHLLLITLRLWNELAFNYFPNKKSFSSYLLQQTFAARAFLLGYVAALQPRSLNPCFSTSVSFFLILPNLLVFELFQDLGIGSIILSCFSGSCSSSVCLTYPLACVALSLQSSQSSPSYFEHRTLCSPILWDSSASDSTETTYYLTPSL